MRGSLLLAIVLIWCKEIEVKETPDVIDVLQYELTDIKYGLQKRSASDIWNSIKNTANHVWQYIINVANNTKKRLADWIAKIRIKVQDLVKTFEERLNKMKNSIYEMIKKGMEIGDITNKCLQERKQEIDEILKNILFDVTNCISNSLNYLNKFETLQYGPIPNQTEFLIFIQNDVNVCLKKYEENDEIEECIQNIRKGIYKNMEITVEYIHQNHTETRDATDDLLDTIVECTTDGIIKSTTIIANETINIIECVASG